jgi:hypothetical protein
MMLQLEPPLVNWRYRTIHYRDIAAAVSELTNSKRVLPAFIHIYVADILNITILTATSTLRIASCTGSVIATLMPKWLFTHS